MYNEEGEVSQIEKVSEVEDLKVAPLPDKGHGADDHDSQDDNQGNSSWIGKAPH